MAHIKIVKINAKLPDENILKEAADIIQRGGLVVFPTETVYGLGGNFYNSETVDKIYEIKKRPKNKPLTVHIANIEMLKNMGFKLTHFAEGLASKFWPGPLTVILKNSANEILGFRIPRHNVALKLIEYSGVPIVAPSANLSGGKPPRDVESVAAHLKDSVDMVLDAGSTEIGIESTVIDLADFPYRILREGAISKSQIADVGRALMP